MIVTTILDKADRDQVRRTILESAPGSDIKIRKGEPLFTLAAAEAYVKIHLNGSTNKSIAVEYTVGTDNFWLLGWS